MKKPKLKAGYIWRGLPDTHAIHISKGAWRPYPYLPMIGDAIVEAINAGGGCILVNIPPRHGKSEFISYHIPLWFLDNNPAKRVILATHTADLSHNYGRRVRNTASENKEIIFKVADDSQSADEWHTTAGGGMNDAGVRGGLSGFGGNLIIVDDPVKDWREADSETFQKETVDWFKTVLWTRREPGAVVVVLMTRWHKKDLAGWLLSPEAQEALGERFKLICLPALAERDDPVGRNEGEALCPERFNVKQLAEIRGLLSSRHWLGLYQQRPTEEGGGLFKAHWLKTCTQKPLYYRTYITTDSAFSEKKQADYSVITTTRVDENKHLYAWEYARGRISITSFINALFDAVDRAVNLQGAWIEIPVNENEDNSAIGLLIRQEMNKRGVFFALNLVKPVGDKVSRAQKLVGMAANGHLFLREGMRDALEELEEFPNGDHDDIVDTLSAAANVSAAAKKLDAAPMIPPSAMSA